MKRIILLIIFLTACAKIPQDEVKEENMVDRSVDLRLTEELNRTYFALLIEFDMAQRNGGQISQERFFEINATIQTLEAKGLDIEKVSNLKMKLQSLKLPEPQTTIQNDKQPSAQIPRVAPIALQGTGCISNASPVFIRHITDFDKISFIQTPPMLVSGQLKTHSYIETQKQRVPVYAPVDMVLVTGAHYVGGPYGFVFEVSCEISMRYGHITEPINEIKEVFPSVPSTDSRNQEIAHRINFKAGDLLGYTMGTTQAGNWDFGVYDSTTKNKYAASTVWNYSTTYTTAVCPYDYFNSELKSQYTKKFNLVEYGNAKRDGESFCD